MSSLTPEARPLLRVVILLSGTGTNFSAIAAAAAAGTSPIEIKLVVSDKPDAPGLERARKLNIPTCSFAMADFPNRAAHDQAMADAIDTVAPQLVILAGYMRILDSAFIAHYQGRLLNIHPALLPEFKGLNTHQRALDARAQWHGCTVHFVCDELDAGARIAQSRLKISENDSAHSLAQRVHQLEHIIYPLVIAWYASGRLFEIDGVAYLDGQALKTPILIGDTNA